MEEKPADRVPFKHIMEEKPYPVPALFASMGFAPIKPTDQFSVTYKDGLLEAHVLREDGRSETVHKRTDGAFTQMTAYEPKKMSTADRDKEIQRRYKDGASQSGLAKQFGVSQSLISLIVRKEGAEKK